MLMDKKPTEMLECLVHSMQNWTVFCKTAGALRLHGPFWKESLKKDTNQNLTFWKEWHFGVINNMDSFDQQKTLPKTRFEYSQAYLIIP